MFLIFDSSVINGKIVNWLPYLFAFTSWFIYTFKTSIIASNLPSILMADVILNFDKIEKIKMFESNLITFLCLFARDYAHMLRIDSCNFV